MSLAPIDFRPRGMMQEIPCLILNKTKSPQPDIFGGEIKPGIRDPFIFCNNARFWGRRDGNYRSLYP